MLSQNVECPRAKQELAAKEVAKRKQQEMDSISADLKELSRDKLKSTAWKMFIKAPEACSAWKRRGPGKCHKI